LGLSFDEMQPEGKVYSGKKCLEERSTGTQSSNYPDYAKIAKQVREWSFRFDRFEKPLEFLKQVEWSANIMDYTTSDPGVTSV